VDLKMGNDFKAVIQTGMIAALLLWAGEGRAQEAAKPETHAHHHQSAAKEEKKVDPHGGHTAAPGEANGNHHASPEMTGMDHTTMDHSSLNPAGMFLMGQSSGTAFQPSAWPMPMLMTSAGGWNFM
jgi:uncharacterized protein involved in copper resistance